MSNDLSGLFARSQMIMQKIALGVLSALALGLIGVSLAAGFGILSWPDLSLGFNGAPIENAGMIMQLTFTGFVVILLFFFPANARIMQLENSHRNFRVRMEDVARAYRAAHEQDRKKLFRIGSEFDSVRARLLHLRDHPDLGALEPEILELAAQMSHESHVLAEIYSDEKVNRARSFLRQRQEEIEHMQDTIAMARTSVDELNRWMLQVETEEGVVTRQIQTLERDLFGLLPELGYDIGVEDIPVLPEKVVSLATHKTPRPKNLSKPEVH